MVSLLSVLLGQPLMLPLEPLLELQLAAAHVGGEPVVVLLDTGAALHGASLELRHAALLLGNGPLDVGHLGLKFGNVAVEGSHAHGALVMHRLQLQAEVLVALRALHAELLRLGGIGCVQFSHGVHHSVLGLVVVSRHFV